MKSAAFYEFIDVLKDRNKKERIESFLEKYSIEEILLALIKNGFGVDAYPGSRSNNDFLELRPLFITKASNQMKEQLFNKYELEINIWNQLFRDFYSKEELKKVTEISDERKLFAFLIMFELYVRALKDRKLNKGKNKDFYGEINLQKNIGGEVNGIDDLSANQFTDTLDYIFQQASKVVQAFIFHGYLYTDNQFVCCSHEEECNWKHIEKSMMYFPLIDIRTVLFDVFEDWKFGDYRLVQHDENNIEISPKDTKALVDEKIEIQRFESFRQSVMRKHNSEDIEEGKEKVFLSNCLAPEVFFDKLEQSSYNEYLEYFSSKNLNYKVYDIEIVKWIRAYAVIRYVNSEFIHKETFPDSNIPEKWLYISTQQEWIERFVKYGIDLESARIICNKLKFKKSSVDWFDAPFIEIGGKIITVPSYTSHIQDSLSLISLATKENLNLDFKGYCFEDRILSDLNTNDIPAVSVKRKVDNEEYQCDVAFILGQDLFLCECKHTSQPITQRKRYDFYNRKIPEDIEQINRISNFYISNIKFILEELNKQRGCKYSNEWKPRSVYKMIIYSCKLTGRLNESGVIITDYTIFSTLLYKRLPTIFLNGKPPRQFMPPNMKSIYQGKLTTNKLLNFIENPWQVGFQKTFTKFEDEMVPVNQMYLHRKKVYRTIDNFYDISK